jgi:hypothetical protein
MGLGDANAAVIRANTEAFIDYRPELVTLVRTAKVSDGMGGVSMGTPSPLLPQRMRMVPTKTITDQAPVRVTSDGQQVTPNWYLVGEYDANIQIGDTTTVRNHKLEVVFVSDLPDHRVVAECWEHS